MAASTGPALLAGGITAANELFLAPGAGLATFNWRILPATAGLAGALALIEHLSPAFATGLGWLAVVTALIIPFGKSGTTPLGNAVTVLGIGADRKKKETK